jgi:hypothetical protein
MAKPVGRTGLQGKNSMIGDTEPFLASSVPDLAKITKPASSDQFQSVSHIIHMTHLNGQISNFLMEKKQISTNFCTLCRVLETRRCVFNLETKKSSSKAKEMIKTWS